MLKHTRVGSLWGNACEGSLLSPLCGLLCCCCYLCIPSGWCACRACIMESSLFGAMSLSQSVCRTIQWCSPGHNKHAVRCMLWVASRKCMLMRARSTRSLSPTPRADALLKPQALSIARCCITPTTHVGAEWYACSRVCGELPLQLQCMLMCMHLCCRVLAMCPQH